MPSDVLASHGLHFLQASTSLRPGELRFLQLKAGGSRSPSGPNQPLKVLNTTVEGALKIAQIGRLVSVEQFVGTTGPRFSDLANFSSRKIPHWFAAQVSQKGIFDKDKCFPTICSNGVLSIRNKRGELARVRLVAFATQKSSLEALHRVRSPRALHQLCVFFTHRRPNRFR